MLDRSDLVPKQLLAVDHLKRHTHCALWMAMGGGKSVCTLTAYLDLLESLDVRHMLVSAPLRVARDVWDAEVQQWAHLRGLTVSKIIGTPQQRITAIRKPADIHTINVDNLAWLFSGYVEEVAKNRFKQIRKWPWDMLALDEAQAHKNQSSLRARIAARISTFGLAGRIAELTGTPASKSYADLWHQLFILDHGKRLGTSEKAFLERWFNPPPDWGFKWTLKPGAKEEIHSRIQDICLSIPDDGAPVPVNTIRVSLPPAAMKQYKKLERAALLEFDWHTVQAVNRGVLDNKLLQLAGGALYTDGKDYQVFHDAKLDALCEALDEASFSGPVAIGYNFISDAGRIGARLDRYCAKWQKWSTLRTEKELAAFERGEIDFGIIHPKSGGHGLNAIYKGGCETLLWMGPTNDLELWDQLNARISGGHRRGKNVRLNVIVANDTVDDDYLAMLRSKDFDQTGLMKALRARVSRS